MRQNLCQASLDVKKKLKYLVLQELIGRSHQLFVSINVWCQDFWNLILSNLILKKCSRSNTLHQSSTWASILMRNIWNVRQGKLLINFFTLQRTSCLIVYETSMSHAGAASGRGEGRRPAKPAQQHLCFQKLARLGRSFPHSSNGAQFLEAFCVVSHIAKKRHHHNHHQSWHNFQYSIDRKVEVKNVFVMNTLTSCCLWFKYFSFNECDLIF